MCGAVGGVWRVEREGVKGEETKGEEEKGEEEKGKGAKGEGARVRACGRASLPPCSFNFCNVSVPISLVCSSLASIAFVLGIDVISTRCSMLIS